MNLRQSSSFHVLAFTSTFLLLMMTAALVACGSNMGMTSNRQLQSITVTPASGMASATNNKEVQFTATGHFNMDPMTAMVPQVTWSLASSDPMVMGTPAGVTINSNGMAQCTTFSGMVTVMATAPMNSGMPISQMGMNQNVTGMAQLTCP